MKNLNKTLFQSNNERQKKSVAESINNFIEDPFVKEAIDWNWDRLAVSLVSGSDLEAFHYSAAFNLVRLTRHPDFVRIRSEQSIPPSVAFRVDENAHLYYAYENISSRENEETQISVAYFSTPVDITHHLTGVADFDETLSMLASIAKFTGGFVTSSKQIAIGQWLRFHGFPLPSTEDDTKELIDQLNFSTLPENSPYLNYWQLLDAPDDSPFKLTEENRALIRQVIENETGGEISLATLYGRSVVLESSSPDQPPATQSYRLRSLIDSAVLHSDNGQAFIDALGWFAEEDDPKPTQQFIEQLMIAVMLLDLDPEAQVANTAFAGFDLYSKRYFLSRPDQVRTQLEQHLVNKLKLDIIIAPLVAELILGGMAPEYLALDLPPKLKIGTPGWVVFTQSVHFAEAILPGISRSMSYQHVLGFGRLSGLSPQLEEIFAATSADPVITWALMNRLVTREAEGNLSQKAINLAMDEYKRFVDQITDALSTLGKPLPHRKPLALKELKSHVPDCDPDELLVKHRGTGGGAGRKVSVIDLYMGDELHTEEWDRVKGDSIYKSFPDLTTLFPVAAIYEPLISRYYDETTEAVASNIAVTLSQLKAEDAEHIELGSMDIYCIRKYTQQTFSAVRPGVVSQPIPLPGETGRYGVILCSKWRDSVRCYELFPLRLQCNLNQKLEPLFRPLLGRDLNEFEPDVVNHKIFKNIPVDVNAYLQNLEPRDNVHSKVFIRKIGEFKSALDDVEMASPPPYFMSPRKMAIGTLIAEENPYFTLKELKEMSLDQTVRERAIEKTDAVFNTILNMIIPFKECIEEMSSGVPSRQKSAIAGCVMDAVLVFATLATVPGKVAATAVKAATVATKLFSASKVLSRTILSLFNPLDGVPQLLKGGGKLLWRGLKKLNIHARSVAHLARRQLRQLSFGNSYDLVKAIDHTGAAPRIRMSLDTVAHGRALFKDDTIETAEQIVTLLGNKNVRLPNGASPIELEQLFNNALVESSLKLKHAQNLESLIGRTAVDDLLKKFSASNHLGYSAARSGPGAQRFIGGLDDFAKAETAKVRYMQDYQQSVLKQDLGKAPYNEVMPESTFNPQGFTDNAQRAGAWIMNGSSSKGNDLNSMVEVLREYAGNNRALTDPALIKEVHARIAPASADVIRIGHSDAAKYGTHISGFAALEQHLKTLNTAHEHFDKHLLASVVGYHGLGDGNGRTGRALYAISQLRRNQFTPLTKREFSLLHGLS